MRAGHCTAGSPALEHVLLHSKRHGSHGTLFNICCMSKHCISNYFAQILYTMAAPLGRCVSYDVRQKGFTV